MESIKYVAYYRVSTLMQQNSGLGEMAQEKAVKDFTRGCTDCIIASFTEREKSSGKNDKRVELLKAIDCAKKNDATLLIAKLDRLSRNAAFIFTLRDTGVKFICCDMPDANSTVIGFMAVLAQVERERISTNTKAALQAKKRDGFKLGSPIGFTPESRAKAVETRKQGQGDKSNIIEAIEDIIAGDEKRKTEVTIERIVEKLNANKLKSVRKKEFTIENVRNILREADIKLPSKKIDNEYRKSTNGKNNEDAVTKAQIRAIELRTKDKTFLEIAEILNNEGFKSSRGKRFHKETVKRLLEKHS